MTMKTVNVATLKQHLSRYLHMVADGQELVVTSHQRPVARVVPEARGFAIRPPISPMSTLRSVGRVCPAAAPVALEMLLEDRRRR